MLLLFSLDFSNMAYTSEETNDCMIDKLGHHGEIMGIRESIDLRYLRGK